MASQKEIDVSPITLDILDAYFGYRSTLQVRDPSPSRRNNDGRLHSLPCNKHGHYICPKCLIEFDSSQKFAAHVRAHYNKEPKEEKRRRLLSRMKHKDGTERRPSLCVTRHIEGLTVAPSIDLPIGSSSSSGAQIKHADANFPPPIVHLRVSSSMPHQHVPNYVINGMPLSSVPPCLVKVEPLVDHLHPAGPPPGFKASAHVRPFTTVEVKSEPMHNYF